MLDGLTAQETRQLLDQAMIGIVLFDADGRVCGWNRVLSEWLGAKTAALFGSSRAAAADETLAGLLTAGATVRLGDAGAAPRFLEVCSVVLGSGEAGPQTEALLYRDVTEQVHLRAKVERLEAALQAEAVSDPATGLLNRRGLLLALEPQVARSRRYDRPLSVIAVHVSDHQGDSAWLTQASQLLKDQLRWADLTAYTEGGQFVIALPETDSKHAQALGDKLRNSLGELLAQGNSSPRVRVGIAGWQRSDNAMALLRRATERLGGDSTLTRAVAS